VPGKAGEERTPALGEVLRLEDGLRGHVVAGGQEDASQRYAGLDAQLVLLGLEWGQDLRVSPPGDDQVADLIQVDADGALAGATPGCGNGRLAGASWATDKQQDRLGADRSGCRGAHDQQHSRAGTSAVLGVRRR
jgi:hypothetical protein